MHRVDDTTRWTTAVRSSFVGGDVDGERGVDVVRVAFVVDVLHRAFVVASDAGKVGIDGARDASGRTRGGAATVFARVGAR